MAMVNVNRENPDQFYRYKMPLIIAKVEGKGNGIKTVIVNMVEVAKALGRPPSYTCKYFGCELGAQTQMDVKIGRFIVNGAHESAKLQDMLDGFIKKFVLCQECDNPETELHVQASKGKIQQGCRACGHRDLIDTRHKLSTFIIKNPPNATAEESSGKKDKKGRRKEKGAKRDKKADSPTHTAQDAENGDDDFLDDPPPIQNGDDGGADDWADDVTEEAVQARIEDLSGHVTNLTLTSDMEKSVGERVDSFYKLVEGFKKSGTVGANVAKIKADAEKLDLMDKAAGILGELLFTEQMISEIKEYRLTLLHFVVDNRKGQKYLLISVERLVGEVFPALLPKVAIILKMFYDNDILEEESILEWADKVPKKHVKSDLGKQIREKAAPFVTWLRTAEEESSEDEDDVEVVYSEAQAGNSIVVQEDKKPQPAQTQPEMDIDIDAI